MRAVNRAIKALTGKHDAAITGRGKAALLSKYSEQEISNIYSIGEKSLNSIKLFMSHYGFTLRKDHHENHSNHSST